MKILQQRLNVREMNVNGIVLRVHGGVENPLFDANQIIVGLLEY